MKKILITNGIETSWMSSKEEIPQGWFQGRHWNVSHTKLTGRICITNGIRNKFIYPEEEIPFGWYKGKTYRVKEAAK